MQNLKLKIKNTTLFSDEDKIAILAAVDTYEESDVKSLERIIDEFDQTYRSAVSEYKKVVFETLDKVTAKNKNPNVSVGAAQIRTGVDSLLSA